MDRRRAWLFQVARNAVADAYRRHCPTQPLPNDLTAAAPEDEPLASLCACSVNHFEALPLAHREALTLADLEGVPQSDVARGAGLEPFGSQIPSAARPRQAAGPAGRRLPRPVGRAGHVVDHIDPLRPS